MNRHELNALSARVEGLLDAFHEAGDEQGAERAEDLVRALIELYGAGLGRVVELADGTPLLRALADDELVGNLLLLHELHPDDVDTRIQAALDRVRPYLGSHAGGVDYVGVDADGVAHLTLQGSCHGCPSSSVTVTTTVERAVLEAAPEVASVEVTGVVADDRPLLQIGRRPGLETSAPTSAATAASDLDEWQHLDLQPRSAPPQHLDVAGTPVLVLHVDDAPLAYLDRCSRCSSRLDDARPAGDVLTCPACMARYDVRRGGRGVDGTTEHLDPIPLLPDGDGWALAVPAGAPA